MLALPGAQQQTLARAGALNAAAALLWSGGDAAAALPLLDEALALARALDDPWNAGWALLHQGTIAYRQGDATAARPLLEAGLERCRVAGPRGRRGVGWGLIFLGDLALDAGDAERRGPALPKRSTCCASSPTTDCWPTRCAGWPTSPSEPATLSRPGRSAPRACA